MTGLHFALPVYYPDQLFVLRGAHPEPIAFMRVLPVSGPEARYGRTYGWKALEDIFVQKDPDLFDLDRPSAV